MRYTDEQTKAIDYATDLNRRVVAITGPAGSGKTTIIRAAVEKLREWDRRVALAAPTGRAARRIYEATGQAAVTLHKLLEYGKPVIDKDTGEPSFEPGPARNRFNPLTYTDIIVDEYAMVNWSLHKNLLAALPRAARIICVGDIHQLAPIERWEIKSEEGTPFENVLKLPSSVYLTTVHRQDEGSGILANALAIKEGRVPRKSSDFDIRIYASGRSNWNKQPREALRDFLAATNIDFRGTGAQIITPTRSGGVGSRALNTSIRSLYVGAMDFGLELPRRKVKGKGTKHEVFVTVGEKVICTENTYDMRAWKDRFEDWRTDVMPKWETFMPCPEGFMMLNGELGIVSHIESDGSLRIQLIDREVTVPVGYHEYNQRKGTLVWVDPRERIDLAYAITTHKMQGNEVDHVCYLIDPMTHYNLSRNNFYTAVTRARKSVTVLANSDSITRGVRTTAAQLAAEQKRRQDQKFKGWSIE